MKISHDLHRKLDVYLRDMRQHEDNARRALAAGSTDDFLFALLEVEVAIQHSREAIANETSPKRNFLRGDV